MRPRGLARDSRRRDLPSSEDVEEGGFAAGAVTATGRQQRSQWAKGKSQVSKAYRRTSFRCIVLLPPQSGIAKEGKRESRSDDLEVARRQLRGLSERRMYSARH